MFGADFKSMLYSVSSKWHRHHIVYTGHTRIYWNDAVWLRWGLPIISFPQTCGESQATQPSEFQE